MMCTQRRRLNSMKGLRSVWGGGGDPPLGSVDDPNGGCITLGCTPTPSSPTLIVHHHYPQQHKCNIYIFILHVVVYYYYFSIILE